MNAIEQIEEQLRRSVAALNPSSGALRGAPATTRGAAPRALARRMTARRPATIATAAVTAAVVLAVSLLGSGSAAGPSPGVAAVLDHLAKIAARGPSLVPGPGQYLYVDSVNDYPSIQMLAHGTGCIAYAVDHRQLWVDADGSGLLRVAALIPGVRLLGMVRDHNGRRGLGVAYTSKGDRTELIFNPRTAALLGESGSGKAPGSSSWAVYIESRLVARVPYPSPRPLTPACVRDAGHVSNVPGGEVITGQGITGQGIR